jgi:polar amino acid transport system substrate-binding protein
MIAILNQKNFIHFLYSKEQTMRKAGVISILVGILTLTAVNIAAAGAVMDRILKKGELVVGITGTQPPLNATARDGKIIGFDADIAKLIASNMGTKVKFETMPFAKLLPALQAGQVDMILSSMSMTLERNLKVAFVGPYYVSGKGILTKAQTIALLQDPEGLNRPQFKIAALQNSTSKIFVEKSAPKAELVTTASYDAAVDMLLKDKIDAVIADYPFCAFTAFRNKENGLVAGQSKLTFEPLGIALQEDTLLINWLRNFMLLLEGSGQLKILNKRWFQDASWIKELP